MSRSSASSAAFFFQATAPTEPREITVQIETGIFAWCESIGIHCFYRERPSDLETFDSFFTAGFSEVEKQKFLIDHGLAVSAAASLFFENVVCFENSGISNDRVMQALNTSPVRRDQISRHDIHYFPFLRDAPTYHCSALFKDIWEVNWFNKLDENAFFGMKSYWVFLKIMLTPNDYIQQTFKQSISDPLVTLNTYVHFLARKNSLRSNFLKDEKFKMWWETLSLSDIQCLFQSFSPSVDLETIKSSLQQLSQDMAAPKFENCFSLLSTLIDLVSDEIFLDVKTSSTIGLHVPLVALRDALLTICHPFFQESELSAQKIITFCRKITNLLNGIESLPFFVDSVKNAKFYEFLRETRDVIKHLQRSLVDSTDEFELIHCVEESVDIQLATALLPANLVNIFIDWLKKPDDITSARLENKMTVLKIFEKTYCAYEKSQNTYMAQTASTLLSTASCTSSWFASKVFSVPVVRAPTPRHDLSDILRKLNELNDSNAFMRGMCELLSLQGNSIEATHLQFVVRLIKQFSREFLAKQYVARMHDSPYLSRELMRQLCIAVPDSAMREVAELFISMMQRAAEPCISTAKEWVTVDHVPMTLVSAVDENRAGGLDALRGADEVLFRQLNSTDFRPLTDEALGIDEQQGNAQPAVHPV